MRSKSTRRWPSPASASSAKATSAVVQRQAGNEWPRRRPADAEGLHAGAGVEPQQHRLRVPTANNQGNATVLLNGVLRNATAPYGKVLDVDHITQSASFPLEEFKTKIGKATSTYIQAKCPPSPWHMKTIWTYNDNTKKTVSQTQPCT